MEGRQYILAGRPELFPEKSGIHDILQFAATYRPVHCTAHKVFGSLQMPQENTPCAANREIFFDLTQEIFQKERRIVLYDSHQFRLDGFNLDGTDYYYGSLCINDKIKERRGTKRLEETLRPHLHLLEALQSETINKPHHEIIQRFISYCIPAREKYYK